MKRTVIMTVMLTIILCASSLIGCTGRQTTTADIGLESLETTPGLAIVSAETTECPELLACVERVDAPLPKPVYTSSGSSSNSADTASPPRQRLASAPRPPA